MSRIFRPGRGSLPVVVAVSAALLLGSLAVPALGGPHAVSAVNALSLAKSALRKAKQADSRSKRALRAAQRVSARGGVQGPPGPAGTPGAAGSPGSDAFGSLTYLGGEGDATSDPDTYVVDAAICPPGEAPTGGSFSPGGSELGGTDPDLGDYGDFPIDLDDPPDGFVDSWVAWAYNGTGSADIFAFAACAEAHSTAEGANAMSAVDPRAEKLRELLMKRGVKRTP
jgi:hypothetical protein